MGRNKSEAHNLALEFWRITGKSNAVCDRCNTMISEGDGYVCKPEVVGMSIGFGIRDVGGFPDLVCKTCFDKSPTAEPFDSLGFRRYMQVPEVVERLKSQAHEMAAEFWKKTRKSNEKCQYCNKLISKGEGYICKPRIVGTSSRLGAVDFSWIPDLICESCFDSSRTTIPPDREAFKRYIKTVEKKWWQRL